MNRYLKLMAGLLVCVGLCGFGGGGGNSGGNSSTSIVSGTTPVTGGSNTDVCFNDSSVINCGDSGIQYAKTGNKYTTLNGLRISGADGGNTIFQSGGTAFSITVASANMFLGKVGGSGASQMELTGDGLQVDAQNGATIQSSGGAIPTATCSGGSTGVSIASGSTNNRGQIVTSSSASTNCTITWSAAGTWANAPFCVASDGSGSTTPTAVSVGTTGTSTMVLDFASATSKTFNWVCM